MKNKILSLVFLINSSFIISQILPLPDHIIIIMLENKGYTQIIGSSNAPYINSLLSDPHCALFSDSHGITHPSQPNYLQLFSGNNQGVTDDNQATNTPYTTCNLAASLISGGYSFGGFSESLPAAGSLVFTSGNYVQRHCPWVSWIGTGTNQINANLHQPYSSFPSVNNYTSLPTVSFIIPDKSNDMHDPVLLPPIAISAGDTWLSNNIPNLITWVKANNSLLIIQYDEDESIFGLPTVNTIPTMFIGAMVLGGTYNNTFTHHGLLRTIEDMYSLPRCAGSSTASPINNCWIALTTNIKNQSNPIIELSLYPNPTKDFLNYSINSNVNETGVITITDVSGRILKEETISINKNTNDFQIDTKSLPKGIYCFTLRSEGSLKSKKIIIE